MLNNCAIRGGFLSSFWHFYLHVALFRSWFMHCLQSLPRQVPLVGHASPARLLAHQWPFEQFSNWPFCMFSIFWLLYICISFLTFCLCLCVYACMCLCVYVPLPLWVFAVKTFFGNLHEIFIIEFSGIVMSFLLYCCNFQFDGWGHLMILFPADVIFEWLSLIKNECNDK